MTILVNKTSICIRNNVKFAMFNRLIRDLEIKITDPNTPECVIIPINMNLGQLNVPFPLLECTSTQLPCINLKCEFVSYLQIFFKKLDIWRLPAFNPTTFHCIICEMISANKLKLSDIVIKSNHEIKIF
jgi:hypothetical protein